MFRRILGFAVVCLNAVALTSAGWVHVVEYRGQGFTIWLVREPDAQIRVIGETSVSRGKLRFTARPLEPYGPFREEFESRGITGPGDRHISTVDPARVYEITAPDPEVADLRRGRPHCAIDREIFVGFEIIGGYRAEHIVRWSEGGKYRDDYWFLKGFPCDALLRSSSRRGWETPGEEIMRMEIGEPADRWTSIAGYKEGQVAEEARRIRKERVRAELSDAQ